MRTVAEKVTVRAVTEILREVAGEAEEVPEVGAEVASLAVETDTIWTEVIMATTAISRMTGIIHNQDSSTVLKLDHKLIHGRMRLRKMQRKRAPIT